MSAAGTVAEITKELFLRLERTTLRYAVLRNYERLPHLSADEADHPVTDVDLVMHQDDVPTWRGLAKSLAEDCGWDVLTECTHFCASPVPEHRIEIFRFYRLSPPTCLQVDIFHGFLVWSVPFEDERGMLDSRHEDEVLKLTRISHSSENVFRMLQLHSLLPDGAPPQKIALYRGKVLDHHADHNAQFRQELRSTFSSFGEQALDALIGNDLVQFQRSMRFSKTCFLGRFWWNHPVQAPRYFYERARDHWCRFVTRQCGFVMPAHAPSDRDRQLLRTALALLTQKKILPAWTDKGGAQPRVIWAEHRVMERGGIAVKWSNTADDSLDVTRCADCDELEAAILERLIARHQPLYTAAPVSAKSLPAS